MCQHLTELIRQNATSKVLAWRLITELRCCTTEPDPRRHTQKDPIRRGILVSSCSSQFLEDIHDDEHWDENVCTYYIQREAMNGSWCLQVLNLSHFWYQKLVWSSSCEFVKVKHREKWDEGEESNQMGLCERFDILFEIKI